MSAPCCGEGTGVCGPFPDYASCRCSGTSECEAIFGAGNACIPASLIESPSKVVLIGPYICANSDGHAWNGCRAGVCDAAGQHCATDRAGNAFCSVACTSDATCGNPGAACCNANCMDGGLCCGICELPPDAGACQTSADCGGATPCCSVSGNCVASAIDGTFCRCSSTSDCTAVAGQECVPEERDIPNPAITGPYSCVDNLGQLYGGCRGRLCGSAGQVCASDKRGNEFCSIPCTSDSSCNNLGVACCNAACLDGGMCCGLCGS